MPPKAAIRLSHFSDNTFEWDLLFWNCNQKPCMTSKQVIEELKKAGSVNIKKIFIKHGAEEPVYGVKVEDMKKIDKKIKDNRQQVALELFDSGIGEAMYLAGLIA